MSENLFLTIFFVSFAWPVILAAIFFTKFKLPENFLSEVVKYQSFGMFLLSFGLFGAAFYYSPSFLLLDYRNWIEIGTYAFKIRFIVDLLGSGYAFLSASLIGIILRYSRNYLHKEEGYFRFVFLLAILQFGLIIVSFSRSLDLLFMGWELVGTTSVLLIGYFYYQNQPVRHSVKAIISYRLCDMGVLAAAAWAHHYTHSTDFVLLPRFIEHAHGEGVALFCIGIFIVWASLAKAGQLPMSSWLPTAMEGPTPSSAIFYGALSVHLGPFLLLRFYEYFTHFPILLVCIGVIGGCSALYATMVGRTRSDAKTMLAYATISQVGIIYIEIALGFTNFALFHMIAHAGLRTYQFLRSSSLIQDFCDNPVVTQNTYIERRLSLEKIFPVGIRKYIFVHALHGFHLDYYTVKIINAFLFVPRFYIKIEDQVMAFETKVFNKLISKD